MAFFAFSGITLLAQPANYYNSANGLTGNQLKIALHNIIKGHTSISYSQILNAYWSTDNKGNGVVWDMYSDRPGGTPPYTFYLGQDECGSYSGEGDCFNREHSWCQSWFNDQSTPRTDLHHIFPTDGYVNGRRSNNPFGEVRSAEWTSMNGSKLGSCKTSGYTGTVFEPIDEYKGDFARAIMYMSVRYYGEDSGWSTSGMTNKSEIKSWAMDMLLRWNDLDPVSQKEINRNNAIYNDYQHNRNPFVDHPEYARMIWDPNWQGTTYTVTLSAGVGGTISPSGTQTVNEGGSLTFSVTPNNCYTIDMVTVNGTPVTLNNNSYRISNINQNTAVVASFVNQGIFHISASAAQHGSIEPNGVIEVNCANSVTFSIMPDEGYRISNVVVDGIAKGALASYTFTNVNADHTINASFIEDGGSSCEAPVGLTALVYQNTVNLIWQPVLGATDYEIYRDGSNVAMVSGVTNWTDRYLSVGEHCYKVVAYCMEGVSDPSEMACATITYQGIDEGLNDPVYIFPNPVERGHELHLSGNQWKFDSVVVCDLCGHKILKASGRSIGGFSLLIPADMQRGCYIVKLMKDDRVVKNLKLVVR